jgi:1-acyl-sn-glycerol-3-phosphate acyltransferase
MTAIRSLAFNLAFFLWTALALVVFLPVLFMPYAATYWFGRQWVRVCLWFLKHLVGLDHRVVGLEHARHGPAIYAAKHQSSWDTLIFALYLHLPAYVLKRELLFLPLFGIYLQKAGHIAVDRSAGARALKKMLAAAKLRRDQGRDILIFPEGTRVAVGSHLPFQPGVAALYSQLDLPVVPVALNSGLYWGRRSFHKKPGTISVEFLPAIPPGLPRRAFMAELEERLEAASMRLAKVETDGGSE